MSTENGNPIQLATDMLRSHSEALRNLQLKHQRERGELAEKAEQEKASDDRMDVLEDLLHYLDEAVDQIGAARDSLVYALKAHESLTPTAKQ